MKNESNLHKASGAAGEKTTISHTNLDKKKLKNNFFKLILRSLLNININIKKKFKILYKKRFYKM